ncbi:MAG: hypothetical protein KDD58_12965 [Bdellovibrionales bacterium]|nr:hypothetical protein [Bdellovibrionales bacterium]
METEGCIDKGEVPFNFSQQIATDEDKERSKTALRLKFEAERQVIRKKLGSLEDIRKNLGLSQRKMCKLLLIDPSTWSRWHKDESKIPPHIYRSLQWYLALIDKSPEWHPLNAYLGAFRGKTQENTPKLDQVYEEIDNIQRQLKTTLHHNHLFMEEMRKQTQIHWGWKLIMLLNLFVLIYSLII